MASKNEQNENQISEPCKGNICFGLFYLLCNVLSDSLLLIHKGIFSQVNCFLLFSCPVFLPIFFFHLFYCFFFRFSTYFIVLLSATFTMRMHFKSFSSIYVGCFFSSLFCCCRVSFCSMNLVLLYDLTLDLEHKPK